jgi:hypothetical protein
MPATTLSTTRRSLHGVAELLLAGPQHRASGEIALRVIDGGFATSAEPDLRFDGRAVVSAGHRVEVAGLSYADIAAELGVEAREPADLYADGSGVRPDETVVLDAAAVATITGAFAAGDEALRRFASGERPILWPEHFDIGITVGDVNYGLAPGDAHVPEPYAYVGPHTPRAGEFWNMPFGAARTVRELGDATGILAFYDVGRRLIRSGE